MKKQKNKKTKTIHNLKYVEKKINNKIDTKCHVFNLGIGSQKLLADTPRLAEKMVGTMI